MKLEIEIEILKASVELIDEIYDSIVKPFWELEEDEDYVNLKHLLKHKQRKLVEQLGLKPKFDQEVLVKNIEEHKNKNHETN